MGWRSVVIGNPAQLDLHQRALRVLQDGNTAHVPLEDVSVLLIEHSQVTLTSALLSALADAQVLLLTIGADHHPNGMLLPYLPHSRALKVMRAQLDVSQPKKKRLWQTIIQQKIRNQAAALMQNTSADRDIRSLLALADDVRSGDPDNLEGQAAQRYFRALWGEGFTRNQPRFINAALNYGYAIIRAAIARSLVVYGFLPAFGIHHRSEQNAFNLADDLIEPYRPLVDVHIFKHWPLEPERELSPKDKQLLIGLLHRDITTNTARQTLLAAVDANVISLIQWQETTSPAIFVMPVLTDQLTHLEDSDGQNHPPLYASDRFL
ncbi:MAG TPA: type II CRISPR-associated endonuclease Cas1 [Thiobacillus sp.]